ncbi:MAG: hypothetical protein BWY57_00380 [Betaproteobacteria bacterium ADurb.Bin341]|nr:MAG: hypothetical protein BWY57_00380 [Betaproteobacteria bacterium ADurb.Bin341]
MTTRTIDPEESERLQQALADKNLSAIGALLRTLRLRIVDVPEIGCMPVLREQALQIEAPEAQYHQLNALSTQDKERLFQILKAWFEAQDAELHLTDLDFFRQP